jgi:hypothetical protein
MVLRRIDSGFCGAQPHKVIPRRVADGILEHGSGIAE